MLCFFWLLVVLLEMLEAELCQTNMLEEASAATVMCYRTHDGRAIGAAYFAGDTIIKLRVGRVFEGQGHGKRLAQAVEQEVYQGGHATALLALCFKEGSGS